MLRILLAPFAVIPATVQALMDNMLAADPHARPSASDIKVALILTRGYGCAVRRAQLVY